MKKRNKRRKKLSRLKKSAKVPKSRIPTCKGGFAFKSKKDYNRADNKEIEKKEIEKKEQDE